MTDALTETSEASGEGTPGASDAEDPRPPSLPPPPGPSDRRGGATDGWLTRWQSMPASGWITLAIVGGCVLFVLIQMGPLKLLSDTTPTGGDMSAHVWGPAFLKDHLLTKGRLTGWSPDWYSGFPAFEFYMVPPFLAIALLSYVLPYGVAFKLVAVSGAVSLPICVWAFGRLNRLPFPVPALMAIGSTFFLFDLSYAIYGGNIASTLAGEFSFAISLSFAILYLGVFGYGLRTGRARGWAALLLAMCALCHVIPAIFAAVGTVIWLAVRPGFKSWRYFFTAIPVGALLMCWWYIPFVGRSAYLNDMGWSKLTDWSLLLFRNLNDSTNRDYPNFAFMVAVAAVGFLVSILTRQRAGVFLGLLAAAMGLLFRFLPDGLRLWNARILPFYYLSVYMLAFAGVGLVIAAVTRWFAADDRPLELVMQSVVVGAVCLASFVYVALPLQFLPFGHIAEDGVTYEAGIGPFQVRTDKVSYLSSWADWNFNGLESYGDKPVKDAAGNETGETRATYDRSYPEFHDLIKTLQTQADTHGCGRAMWEYEENHDRYGSTMEPMMLPHFTDGCIGSMEGLYFEASSTTPYHFINSTQLSKQGSAPQKDLPYATMPPNQADFDQGVGHLQMLGVKYYMAIDDSMKERAAVNPNLQHLADSGPWSIYLVNGSELVTPLTNQPAVLTGPKGVHDWLATSACWYVNEQLWSQPLVSDGPEDWQQVTRTVHPPEKESAQQKCSSPDGTAWGWLTDDGPEARPLEEVKVSNIQTGDDTMSFDVDKVGVPVLVKTSYFPNWEATGATGPYRSTPNLMVVVPTANHVELHYGISKMEIVAYNLTFLGVALLALLFVARPLRVHPVTSFWAKVEDPERGRQPGMYDGEDLPPPTGPPIQPGAAPYPGAYGGEDLPPPAGPPIQPGAAPDTGAVATNGSPPPAVDQHRDDGPGDDDHEDAGGSPEPGTPPFAPPE